MSILRLPKLLTSRDMQFILRATSINSKRQNSSEIFHPPDNEKIKIPPYIEKTNESLEVRKARLLYQSRKRGMLENDLLLSTFAEKFLKNMNLKQVEQYDQLINQPSNDWEIYYWGTCAKPTPKEFDHEVMELFKQHVKNVNKEKRLRQPNLY